MKQAMVLTTLMDIEFERTVDKYFIQNHILFAMQHMKLQYMAWLYVLCAIFSQC